MNYVSRVMLSRLHRHLLETSGGGDGIRDDNALESALAQPRMTFGGVDLYPSLVEKATALGYSLIMNHPYVDGNKRVGHAAMEVFLELNGFRIVADTDDAERLILAIAAGQSSRGELLAWLQQHLIKLDS